jgi:hypothetical protein
MGAEVSWLLRQKHARVVNLGPALVGTIGDRDDFAEIFPSLSRIARPFGGLRRASALSAFECYVGTRGFADAPAPLALRKQLGARAQNSSIYSRGCQKNLQAGPLATFE